MKTKKLLAFLLCFVIVFAGLPVIAANADEASPWQYLAGYRQTIDTNNRTKAYYGEFTVPSRGVVLFRPTRLFDINSQEQYFRFDIYRTTDLTNAVWSSVSTKCDVSSDGSMYLPLIGLDKGEYVAKITPSMYSSSFPSGQNYTVYFDFYFWARNDYEIEPNNSKEKATPVAFDSLFYTFADSSDDYFAVTVEKDTLARIKIKNFETLVSNNVYVKLFPANGGSADYLLKTEASTDGQYLCFDIWLKAGTNYLNITPYSGKGQIEFGILISKQIKLDTPVVYKKTKSGTTANIYWNIVSGADGYEIQRKINKGGWKTELTNSGADKNGLKQTGSNFKNTYQFRIRAFKKVGSTTIYSNWSKVISFNPTPTNIKLSTTNYTYTGGVKKPKVVVKNALGVTLKENVDYKVTYASGRKYVGKYKVVITFKGEYSGTKSVYFKINPKTTSVSSITAKSKSLKVKVKKQTSQTSGYQIQYSTSKKFSSAKTVTIKSNKTTSSTIKKLKGNKKYYVRVRTYKKVGGSTFYSSWSSAKSKKTKR